MAENALNLTLISISHLVGQIEKKEVYEGDEKSTHTDHQRSVKKEGSVELFLEWETEAYFANDTKSIINQIELCIEII